MTDSAILRMAASALFGVVVALLLETGLAEALFVAPALMTAGATFNILQMVGVEAEQQATVIAQPFVFAYDISHSCLGILPAAVLAFAMAISPADWHARFIGILLGVSLVLALNLVRLVHLFLVGISLPQFFWAAHHLLWNAVMFAAAAGLFLTWLQWSQRWGTIAPLNYRGGWISKQRSPRELETV